MLETYVGLLRGINVGGHNELPMKELAAMFRKAGCADVRTYIQSGNVVFTAEPGLAASIAERIAVQIFKVFGYRTPVILRSALQLREVIAKNPFLKAKVPEAFLHVMLLADQPRAHLIAALDPERSPGDCFQVLGKDVYLHLPNGVARSKLTNAYFDSKLKTIGTQRNWRTVCKLATMMEK